MSAPNSDEEGDFWTCNLDRRGRLVRGVLGVLACGAAGWLWFGRGEAFWSIGLVTFGVLGLAEAIRGWCALRALGLKIPF